ncbi:MAG: ParA family protein [Oscillatoriales cyanobacterium SM2_1_8]|nr:ParA family protein [Oscillatoriales cyanobacterium SM2_1_8]
MSQVIAFTNSKGGTGKSTLCANLAHTVAETGARVLLIDLTPQVTCTSLFLGGDMEAEETIVAALKKKPEKHLEDLVRESDKGLDVVPAHTTMADAVLHLSTIQLGKEGVLKREIERVRSQYDYIFIDSPGDLNELTVNAMVPATKILIPTRINRTDFSCTETTVKFIRDAEELIGPRTVRVVVNMLDPRYLPNGSWHNSHAGRLYHQAQETFNGSLCAIAIPDSSDVRTAFDRGQTVGEYRRQSVVAQRIRELAQCEVLGE